MRGRDTRIGQGWFAGGNPVFAGRGHRLMLLEFLFIYPFVLSFLWTTYGLVYLVQSRRRPPAGQAGSALGYSVIVPFHNEPEGALRTAWSLVHVTPAPRAVLLVDDGSAESIPEAAALPPATRLIRMAERGGKANALNAAMSEIETDIVVCLDADTTAVSQDWNRLLTNFSDPGIGGVTGKIWPAGPRGLLQRMQHLDYVSVICLIKAAESCWGSLLTVSGALVAFRRSALQSVQGWNVSTATEDIDLSWRLQAAGWRIRYESEWVGRVEMVPTLAALWRQRRRWSMGLGRALRDHFLKACTPQACHLPIATVALFNTLWISLTLLALGWLAAGALSAPGAAAGLSMPGGDHMVAMLASMAVFAGQFACAVAIDRRPWRTYLALVFLVPFYPVYFWGLLFSSFLAGFPVGLLRRDSGTWARTLRIRETASLGVGT